MLNDRINLLVTFDEKMIRPFETMLYSMIVNNPGEEFSVWLMHSGLTEEQLWLLNEYCIRMHVRFSDIYMDKAYFEKAPVMQQYPQEMYYRLLASCFLPEDIRRILYLDPDILILNPINPLWNLNLENHTFAAAFHSGVLEFVHGINRIRLETDQDYFNTGVILMDMDSARKVVKKEAVFSYVKEHSLELMLPDQDIFNALYSNETYALDDRIWNYDARRYAQYMMKNSSEYNMDWVMQNTAVLHFCGKNKPWRKSYSGRFSALYKHYWNRAGQICLK
ncbi:MAG: glycosyltransferase family 8 protein [Clostridiales bacterium]|nr:glycosyltransferase family 8 protein [Clostridiales bacterium]